MPPKDVSDPKAEIARLKAKLATIPDRDIRAAIQERIDVLAAQVFEPEPTKAEEKEPEAPPPPPTPQQSEQAERLVRQAMLEKQRGNKVAVTKLLEEAVAVAPGAPATLEALGDDFAERRRVKKALECYKRAMALDPKNVGLEKKHANLVFNVGTAGTIEQQLRANSDSFLLTSSDHVANLGVARILSFFVPGSGHILLGRTGMGIGLLATYIACFVWLFLQRKDVSELVKLILGGRGNFGMGIFPPMIIATLTIFVAVGSLGADRAAARSVKPQRPTPPVNLPFD